MKCSLETKKAMYLRVENFFQSENTYKDCDVSVLFTVKVVNSD